jgi:hypothetical protein
LSVPDDRPVTAVSSSRGSRIREVEDDFDDRRSRSRVAFHCPFCQSSATPIEQSKISGAGWITFALFLLFFCPLCWVGLLMKESYRVCASCGMKLG